MIIYVSRADKAKNKCTGEYKTRVHINKDYRESTQINNAHKKEKC